MPEPPESDLSRRIAELENAERRLRELEPRLVGLNTLEGIEERLSQSIAEIEEGMDEIVDRIRESCSELGELLMEHDFPDVDEQMAELRDAFAELNAVDLRWLSELVWIRDGDDEGAAATVADTPVKRLNEGMPADPGSSDALRDKVDVWTDQADHCADYLQGVGWQAEEFGRAAVTAAHLQRVDLADREKAKLQHLVEEAEKAHQVWEGCVGAVAEHKPWVPVPVMENQIELFPAEVAERSDAPW
ncbi:hypothetical protein [Salinactinospora qingdaonensis]|uniref:Uncharacterized protein n=1 Tax=Salinactinospora qingdaonensis TaxID=702744 RepID=A0ABP7FSL8_9ACTN